MIETLYSQLVGSVNNTNINIDQCEIDAYRYICDAIIIDINDNNRTKIKVALEKKDAQKLIERLTDAVNHCAQNNTK